MTLRHSPVISPLKPKEYIITLVNPPICIIFKCSYPVIATLYCYILIRCIEDLALVGAVRPLGSVRGRLYTCIPVYLYFPILTGGLPIHLTSAVSLIFAIFLPLLLFSHHHPFHH